jgi:putative transposase
MVPRDDADVVGRRTPAQGVVLSSDMPLILFCTVCADEKGVTWVAQETVMRVLHEVWSEDRNAWLVGGYVLMPDHMHFFCCPRRISEGVGVERWVLFWKDQFAKRIDQPEWRWERGVFHTRMRSDAHYREKQEYVSENPVKASLMAKAEDWPWRGCVHDLSAHIRSFGEPKEPEGQSGSQDDR